MDDELELVSDGDSLAVVGKSMAVERFLRRLDLLDVSKDLGLDRLGPLVHAGAEAVDLAAKASESSGRWLKLTPEAVEKVKHYGLMPTKTDGESHAMIGRPGSIDSWLQVENGAGALLTNPAMLAGAAGLMHQVATRSEMTELRDYLVRIDIKLDEVIRAQNDAQLAPVDGAGYDIESAIRILDRQGAIDDDTWSTVQGRQQTISDGLAWAQRRLAAIAEGLEGASKIGELTTRTDEARSAVSELLAVLARCFELQDALDVMRLDRALQTTPERLDTLRRALADDRSERRSTILDSVEQLVERMDAAGDRAASHAVLHLPRSRAAVTSVNEVAELVDQFREPLGVPADHRPLTAPRWRDAVRSRDQLARAGVEVARKAATAGAAAAVGVAFLAANAAREKDGKAD